MKKYIILIIWFFIFSPHALYAEECNNSCQISDAPAPALTEYLTNVEKIRDNILWALSEAEPIDNSTLRQERNRVIAGFNSILSFGDFFGSFDYHISLPVTNEVPREVKRDHNRITKQTDRLESILEKAERRAIWGTQVENVCNGVSNCDFPSTISARELLTEIINNNQKVAQLYRASITERPALLRDQEFILVSSDFVTQIETYYNKDTLTACSSCEWGFLDTVRESISNISFKNSDYKEWVQKWKDAWAMLRGGSRSNPDYKRREAELLSQYLSSQWQAGTQADSITSNLERYNEWGLSTSNPLSNSAYHAQAGIENEAKTFEETLREKFAESWENKVPLVELVRVDAELQTDENLQQNIASLYDDQIPFALSQDTQAQELQLRIIRMHFDLVWAINMLGKQVKSTEKLCDKQATWRGRCSFR